MDLSLFSNGTYNAKKIKITTRESYKNGQPFALVMNVNKHKQLLWDMNAFSPPLKDLFPSSVSALVLFETRNCRNNSKKTYKIPRYIYIDDEWYTNIR